MKTRNRSYAVNKFDYQGVGAIGDVMYSDGFDKWSDIQKVFDNSGLNVPIVEMHDDKDSIGKIRHFQLDSGKKTITVGFNQDDLVSGYELEDFNGVSPQWIIDDETDSIIGINHFAISNKFEPQCPKKICKIEKNRSNIGVSITEKLKMPDNKQENSVKTENDGNPGEEPDYKKLYEELSNKVKEPATEPEPKIEPEPEPEPETKLKLKEKEGMKQEIKTKTFKKGSFFDWKDQKSLTKNTQRVFNNQIYK